MKKETTTLTLRVPIATKIQLEMIANKEQRTVNSLVNKILQEYIDERKKMGTTHNVWSPLILRFWNF
jgi:predicted DNA-binding protein